MPTIEMVRSVPEPVAYVTVAASHAMPELKVPLIHELPDMWKIDVPDSVDGSKLYDNLLTHLTMANEHKDQWPADVNDAYRMVAHHVLMAVLDVNENAQGAANQGSAQALWCLRLGSGAASGWPGTDWIEDLVLRQAGPDVYDKWVAGTQTWTSPEIKTAFETFGKVVSESYGGPKAINSCSGIPRGASSIPFRAPRM